MTLAAAGAGAYAGVRAALARLDVRVGYAAAEAERAHRRIDGLLMRQSGMTE